MKKILEIAAVLLVVFLLFVLAASVVLHIFLPPEKAKALVLKQLTGRLKREVQVGSVSVGVLSGLDLGDLKISESPDFAHGTFISSDRFTIRLAILPLLFRKVVVKQLALRHPLIHLIRYPDGKTFNFSDLTAPPAPSGHPSSAAGAHHIEGSPDAEAGPPFYLVVSNAQIQNGSIRFEDRSPARQSVDVDPLDLKLRNVSLKSPFHVQASLRAKSRGVEATIQLAGEANLRTASFKIKNCVFSSGGSAVRLSGQASGLKSERPSVDLRLTVKEFKLATLAAFAPLPPGLSLVGPIIAEARLKGDQKRVDFSAMADLTKVTVAMANRFSKPMNVPMRLSVEGRLTGLKDVQIQSVKTILGSMQFNGHGDVQAIASQQPQANFHMESNTFPIGEITDYASLSLPKELNLKGDAQLSVDISGTQISSRVTAKCEGKNLALAWADKFVKPSGAPLHLAMEGEILRDAQQSTFNVQDLNATFGSIAVSGKGSLQNTARTPKFQLVLATNAWPLKDLAAMAPPLAPYHVSGTATLNVRASGFLSAPMMNGTLGLKDASVEYQRSVLSQVSTTISFTEQDVSIPRLSGKLNGSDIALKLVGHRLTTQPELNVEANIAQLDLDKLLPPLAPAATGLLFELTPAAWAAPAPRPPMTLSGHLSVGHIKQEFYDAQNLDMKWKLAGATPDLAHLGGTASLKQGAGKLTDVEKLAERSRTARIALLPIITLQKIDRNGLLKKLGLPSLQSIPFDGIHGDYFFQSGTMNVKTFELAGRDMNVSTLGTIGLAGEQLLNLRITTKLMHGGIVGGTLGELITDESGRPMLTFTVQGPAVDPQIRLDMREAGRKAVQKVGEQIFKGLGLGGTNAAAPSNETAPSQAPAPPNQLQNPAQDIQKALKNIFH